MEAKFPKDVNRLLQELEAPERLIRHLFIVHETASLLVNFITKNWPEIAINQHLILFGAATHDIGKTRVTNELYESGNLHENEGEKLLLDKGYTIDEARFASNHSNWQNHDQLEDLLVSLADKVWKGKRIPALEFNTAASIAKKLNQDVWEIEPILNAYLDQLALQASSNLNWQKYGE